GPPACLGLLLQPLLKLGARRLERFFGALLGGPTLLRLLLRPGQRLLGLLPPRQLLTNLLRGLGTRGLQLLLGPAECRAALVELPLQLPRGLLGGLPCRRVFL